VRARELLDRVGLLDRARARRHELSGGQQQRIALCAALAARPRLLLADEPTGELDAHTGDFVLALIAELARAEHATAILATHDPAANRIADRTLALRDGRVVAERKPPDGDELLVVDPSGLLRLDPTQRQQAAITTRARAHAADDTLVLSGQDPRPHDSRTPPGHAAQATVRPKPLRSVAARVVDLTHVYHSDGHTVHALGPLNHSFAAGRLHIISGPSGSGKTTLLQLLAGLEAPTSGHIVLGDDDLTRLDRTELAALRRQRLGLVAQASPLIEFLTARENAELPPRIRGHTPRDARSDAERALAAVDLQAAADQRADTLSGGQRARLALARALTGQPQLLLVDEPTASLDQANAGNVAQLLHQLTLERELTILCATHDPIVARQGHEQLELGRPLAPAPACA
jgi:ABC-type lipoprotein export system ATPase subunit